MSDRKPTGISSCPKHNRYEALYPGINEANDPHEPARLSDDPVGGVISERLTPIVMPDESVCDCGLYAAGYRESWAIRHSAGCAYAKVRTA